MGGPTYGHTASGHPLHERTHQYHGVGFNGRVARVLTVVVGTMWCFWVFNGIALTSLPETLSSGKLNPLIAWISSNWIQLILLPALMVGQDLQNRAADARSAKMLEDVEHVKAALDSIHEKLDNLEQRT